MVEHLPAASALSQDRLGPWRTPELLLLREVESRLRDLIGLTANMWKEKGEEPFEVTYLEPPGDLPHGSGEDEAPALESDSPPDLRQFWFPGND